MSIRSRFIVLALLVLTGTSAAQDATLRIDATKVRSRVGGYLAGACIEDVNHEIYGGLYSQMIFGESFQEPPSQSSVKGFRAFGGDWELRNGELLAGAGDGPKLVSDHRVFRAGEVGVEVYFPDGSTGNAGLIVDVNKAATGADNWFGYEVSLNPQSRLLTLGRHRRNWEPIKDVPCDVPTKKWIALAVKMTGKSLEVSVDGKEVMTFEDREHPLPAGKVGLRQWQREARYRNMWVKTDGQETSLPFEHDEANVGAVSGMWGPLRQGSAKASFSLETDRPFVGTQCQKIAFVAGDGAVGLENRGLNRQGMCFQRGKEYEGHVWVRADKATELWASLESGDGAKHHAEAKLPVESGDWRRLDFTLRPTQDDTAGRFALKLKERGAVYVGYVYLQPGEWGRFKSLPVRKDVVDGLIEQKLNVLRYGGSLVNHDQYRWKKMIGPRDRRPPYAGTWYRYSTNGWGILDFLDLCESAGFLGIPAFNMGESPGDMADFLEYVNGAADTEWGAKRAAGGHAKPYALRYLELGNEERVDEKYFERFRALAEAIWAKDSRIVLVVGDFAYGKPITDVNHIAGAASGITNLAGHRKILELAKKHGREVWFDVHLDTEGPGVSATVKALPSYCEALDKIADGAKHRVVVFELNAGNHALRRALANAAALNAIERLGDRVAVVCSANGLQVEGQNDNGWDQGLLFMNPCKVWPQPPYFVSQHFTDTAGAACLATEVRSPGNELDVTAVRRGGEKALRIQVVNLGAKAADIAIRLDGFAPSQEIAQVTELAGALDEANTAAAPQRIAPRLAEWKPNWNEHVARYTFPPYSFTVLRLE
jgi:alpha-L-arabinofuranosidase